MQTGECKAWGSSYYEDAKKNLFSYKYERYGYPGLGCTDKNGAPASFINLAFTPTNCSFAFDKNTVGQFNEHLASYGGCAHGDVQFKVWYYDWYTERLANHPKKTHKHFVQYGLKEIPVEERAEACRLDAEAKDECAGGNYYMTRTRGGEALCQCGVTLQLWPQGAPNTVTCLLKSKPVTDLKAIGTAKKPNPKPSSYNGDRTMKKPGVKSTFKMSTNFTGCSKGWWHITGEKNFSRYLYSHGDFFFSKRGRVLPGPLKSQLPSACVNYAKSFLGKPNTGPQTGGCKGAIGVMMRGVGTSGGGQPQDHCYCFWEEHWATVKQPVSAYAYPNYGQTLHENLDNDVWVCMLDDEDATGGDDVYPIPDASGVVSRDGPKPQPKCEPNPVLKLFTVSNSNLGGKGPDLSGEQNVRFSNVGKVKDVDVDMTMTISSGDYTGHSTANNGLSGSLGTVNLRTNTNAEVDFALVESGTNNRVAVDSFSIMWLDVDEGKRGKQRSTITACDAESLLDASTELTSSVSGSCESVSSSKKGTKQDNPNSVEGLTDVQKAKTVTFKYGAGSVFHATLRIGAGHKRSGRNFNFAIAATVDCP